MSSQKSTIDRSVLLHPEEADASTGHAPVPMSAALHRTFGVLERWSPRAGGALAERLWFRLPRRPAEQARERRTPPGGEPFEVRWEGGIVRGRVYGAWGDPTAYLVHGWGGWWQQLAAHVQPLVDAGLCVVAFDAPSHGSSDPGARGPQSTTVVEMAQALAAVVRDFGRPVVVVAHSLGAMATVHARGLGVAPDAYALIAAPHSVRPMTRLFAAALGIGPRSEQVMAQRIERRVGEPLSHFDLVAAAREIPTPPPLLVVHDRSDRETPAAGSTALAQAWPGSRLLLTDGLGHRRVIWEPEVVRAVTRLATEAAQEVRRSSR